MRSPAHFDCPLRAGLCAELDETYLLQVYVDRVFGTFAFQKRLGLTKPAVSGTVTSARGRPIAAEPVTLLIGGKSYVTYTDRNGAFRFYDKAIASGKASLKLRNTVRKRFMREAGRPKTGLEVKLG